MNAAQMLWAYLTANVAVMCSECDCSVVSMTESLELSSNLTLAFNQWVSHLSTSQRVCAFLYFSASVFLFLHWASSHLCAFKCCRD